MGLDQYAWTTAKEPHRPVDFSDEEYPGAQLFQWRKHPNLHGWMEALYREKGGSDEMFNCSNLHLTAEDLDRLEADIKADALPETVGFFVGTTRLDERDLDFEFLAIARDAITNGGHVYYSAWW